MPHNHPDLTNGEACVMLAPVAGCEPEEIDEYLLITLTAEGRGVRARVNTSMDDEEAIEVLARAINHFIQDHI